METTGGRATRPEAPRAARALVALLAVLAVLAAACGGDDGSSDADGGTSGEGATDGTEAAGSTEGPDGERVSRGPQPQPLAEETDATVVMAVNIETFAPALLAEHFGEFEKENLDVTIQNVPSNEGTVMVAQGQAQLKMAGMSASYFNAVAQGVDVVWLANIVQNPLDTKEGVWMRSDLFDEAGDIIPEELEGTVIAGGTGGIGSPSVFAINEFLEDNGSSLDEVEIASIGGSDMVVAIEGGSIDGGYVLTPQWLTLEEGDDAQFVGMYGEFAAAGFSASAYEMSQSFIDEEPEVAAAIMRALARTVATYLQGDYHADPEVLDGLAEMTGTPAEAIAQAPSLVFDPDLPLNGEMVHDIQVMWLDHAPGTLEYEEPIPVEELTDRSLVEQVLAGADETTG